MQRYLSRISGPLLDRIDVHVEVMPVPFDELRSTRQEERSKQVLGRVMTARAIQQERFKGEAGVHCNALMGSRLVRRHCTLDEQSQQLMKMAIDKLGLSARAYDRILKVSRTIADLGGVSSIKSEHVSEAIQYRALDRKWGEMQGG